MRKQVKTPRSTVPQLNVRSAFAVQRARELATRAGVTTTQIVEDALRTYEVTDTAEERRRWEAKLDDILKRTNDGQPPVDWRAIEDEMYDEWGNAR